MWEHPFHQHLFDVRIAAQDLQRFRPPRFHRQREREEDDDSLYAAKAL